MLRATPGAFAPALTVPLLDGDRTWTLARQRPPRFTAVVFYRGLHCGVCRDYLGELDDLTDELLARGTEPIAISADDRPRAARTRREWGLERLPLGYALPLGVARRWGLFISEAIRPEEPELFSEPGLFLVDREGRIYAAAVTSMPLGRPPLDEVLHAIDLALDTGAPARGEAA